MKTSLKVLCGATAFIVAAICTGAVDSAAHTVDDVVVSRDFGFDPVDSTRFLQSALSSGAAKIVVDRQASDWVVTPLKGASNQTVVFEDGVVLRAKPGELHGRADCLLSYVGCTNVTLTGYGATLKMERSAYDRPPYKKSEHRHVLSIRGGLNIRVEGLTLAESGGDGVYLVTLRRDGVVQPPEKITLKDLKCVRNYRQGLSVTAVKGLLCENCDFSETAGTPPESGIDFEPNFPDEALQDIVVRNCRFENNKGRGFEFYLGQFNSTSPPVTARFENCITRGNVNGFEFQQRRAKFNDLPSGGRIELSNCTFERSTHAGILMIDKPKSSADIVFRDCRLINCCTVSTNGPDVRLETRLWDTPPVSGVDFGNLEICQPFVRLKFSEAGTDWTAPGVTVPRGCEMDLSKATVVDPAPGEMRELDGVCPAGLSEVVFFVEKPRTVAMRTQLLKLSKHQLLPAKASVWRDGVRLKKLRLRDILEEPAELAFTVPAAGFYSLRLDAGRHAVCILAADVPLAVKVANRPQLFAAARGKAYFQTAVRQPFALFAGAGSHEKGAVKVVTPSGEKAWSCNPVTKWERFQPAACDVEAGMWCVELLRPKGMRRAMFVDVTGTGGYLFLSPERYWSR